MKCVLPALAALLSMPVLCTTATGQNPFTSPAGFLSTEGATWSSWFGSSSYGRHSLQDGTLRNKTIAMKEIAMRHDTKNYYSIGRRWFSVELRMSECNISSRINTWTQMAVTTPTTVFKSTVTWPAVLSKPTGAPQPFRIRFPFSKVWQYSGRNDLNADFEFVGGVLDNNRAWKHSSGTTYSHSLYNLDSAATGYGGNWGAPTTIGRGCTVGGSWFGAATTIEARAFSDQYIDPAYHNRALLKIFTSNTSYGKAVVIAVGVGATAGQTFPGITCEKNYIDATKPVLYFRGPQAVVFFGRYQNWFAGLPLVSQAIFDTSTSGQLALTSASRTSFPALPPRQPERYYWRSDDWTKKTGVGPYLGGVPLVRITR